VAVNVEETVTTGSEGTPPPPDSGIRNDVDGLRAIAVFLVIAYHVGLGLFGGGFVGVDIFFVISGFVITRQLYKEVGRTGRVSLVAFYARRAKRLLPAASVVLAGSAVMTWLFLPKIRWQNDGGDIFSAAFYYINWHLIGRSVNYLAEDQPPSVVQHFWSLAIEEQFYLIWPFVILAALWFSLRFRSHRGLSLVGGLAVIAVPSFLYNLYLTDHNPARSYFDTGVRIWEFAIGAAVALLAARLNKMPPLLGLLISWGGLAMLLVSGVFYDDSMNWPGSAALVPTVGAGLLIAGGVAAGRAGPVSLLGTRPMLFLGHLSYSLYLWHWPLIIVAQDHYGTSHLSTRVALLLVVLPIVPAYLTYRLVENPFRYSRLMSTNKRVAYSVGLNASLIGGVAGLALIAGFAQASNAAPRNVTDTPGAASLGQSTGSTTIPVDNRPGHENYDAIFPNPLKAPEDVPALYAAGCQIAVPVTEPKTCRYGSSTAGTTVAVVGDSKAAQWVPAFQALAKQNDWRVITYTKSACAFATITTALDGKPYQACRDWTDNVIKALVKTKPDYVVTTSLRGTGIVGTKNGKLQISKSAMIDALANTWTTLERAGIKVISLADTPQPGKQVYTCVSEHEKNYFSACTYDRAKGVRLSNLGVQSAAAKKAHVPFIDMTPYLCPPAYKNACPPVIGNVMIYRQGSHITKTYIETMSAQLDRELRKAGVR